MHSGRAAGIYRSLLVIPIAVPFIINVEIWSYLYYPQIGLFSTLILVRLLTPSDFDILALAASFAQTIDGLMILGTEEAVIRNSIGLSSGAASSLTVAMPYSG